MIEKNIGKELTGEVADDDALAGRLMKETFAGRQPVPIAAFAADFDALHGVVENDLAPEIFQGAVENGEVIFGTAWNGIWGRKLAVESPEYALIE